MRYGFCKEFATPMKTEVDYDLVKAIRDAGFDYIEMRLMLVAALSDEAFDTLTDTLRAINLPCEVCCALFPKSVRVTGKEADDAKTAAYLDRAFHRAHVLGAKKVVFGSAGARELDAETSTDEGYAQLQKMITDIMLPLCERYDITVVIEPLRRTACNFINTLEDGMRLVNAVHSERVRLLADGYHMLSNGEPAAPIVTYRNALAHVHIADDARALPEDGYSAPLADILAALRQSSYDGTISFESRAGSGVESMKKALCLLKNQF